MQRPIIQKLRSLIPVIASSILLSTSASAQDGISADVSYSEAGWSRSDAFGWFARLDNNWLYHYEHGFMAEVPLGPGSSYLWSEGQGWWFVNLHSFPWIYDAESGEWIYYGGKQNVRWFFRPGTGHWITDVQHENIKDLHHLLKDLHKQSEVTPELVESYRAALKTLIENTEGPSEETLDAYAELHAAVFADGEVTDEEKESLKLALDAVLESIVVAEEDAESVRAAWLAIIDASNITDEQRAELEELIGVVVDDLRDRHPGWRGKGPRKPHTPGLRNAYSMMLELSHALVDLIEPDRRPHMAFIRNFVRHFGRAFTDQDVSEDEHESISESITKLRGSISLTPEQDSELYNILRRFADARIEDEAILTEVYVSIDLGFGIGEPAPEDSGDSDNGENDGSDDPEPQPETPEI